MNVYDLPPVSAALDAASSLVTALTQALEPLAGGQSTAAAIVLVTLLVRLALIPVGISQGRAERTRRRLAPLLRELQRKHAKSPEALQRATMKLYADEKASPFAGCLPVLIQAPVVSLLYGLFIHPDIAGHGNALLEAQLLGAPLGSSFASVLAAGGTAHLPVFVALLAVIAIVSALSRRAASQQAGPAASPELARLTGALSWLPFLTVIVGALVPLAATTYLALTTTWTLCERMIVRRVLARNDG
jgi:YidC/Oxa1 family membrane protein insertase